MINSRKAEKPINRWISSPDNALIVTGARQVGKTFTIRKCLQDNNCDYVEINLVKNPELVEALRLSENSKDIAINISAATGKKLTPGKTFIFIDEVQQYKEMVTKIKFLVDEGIYHFCLSGSLLGVEITSLLSAPVGYLDEIIMYPLDFEEFLIANDLPENVFSSLSDAFNERKPVPELVHTKIMELFRRYLVVGGMPAAVSEYLSSGDINKVTNIQKNIISQYKKDFTKYEADNKKLMIIDIYESIASQLLKQNRRFNYADIKKGLRFERVEDSFLWLTNAGVSLPVYNATEPKVSLYQNKKSNLLKLFSSDVGLLTCMYGSSAKLKLLINDRTLNSGGIYENMIAQELHAHGFPLYYYNSHKLGELDFVIEYRGNILPLEIKSGKDYTVHSAISNVVGNSEFKIDEGIVFADCNVTVKNKITYLPVYMIMFLHEEVNLPVLEKLF